MYAVVGAADEGRAAIGIIFVIALVSILCAFVGRAVGITKGLSGLGTVLGLLMGPVGVLVMAFIPRTPEAEAAHVIARDRALDEYRRRGE